MFMDPIETLGACALKPSENVADFGAGSGFMTRAASRLVPEGHVYAVEINRDLVARLTRDATEGKLENVHPLWGDIEVPGGTRLDDESMHFVIFSNVLFHLDDKPGALKEAWRVLKPGGRLLLVDWSESFGGIGPAPHAVVSKSRAEELARAAGFSAISDAIPAGEHHYGTLWKK